MTSEGGMRGRFHRILVAIDGSDGAATALRAALDLAAQAEAALVVLNVFERDESSFIHAPDMSALAGEGGGGDAGEGGSRTILGEAKAVVDEHPGVAASFVFLEGDAAREILRYAAETNADLIVLGRSGHGRIVGLVLGSVSQKVVSLAATPTMIVPPAAR